MEENSCTFTGHHPMRFEFGYNEEEPLCLMIKQAMKSQIFELYKQGVKEFYTDCELMVGLWAGELILELMEENPEDQDLYLCCTIPYEHQTKKWPEFFRDRYYEILEKSTYNELISAQETDKCRQQCGRYLIDHAEHLIAVYDNSNVTRMETAAYVVSCAKRKGRSIIYINPDTAEITINS